MSNINGKIDENDEERFVGTPPEIEKCSRPPLGYAHPLAYTPPHPHHVYCLTQPMDYPAPILNLSVNKRNQMTVPKPTPPLLINQSAPASRSPGSTTSMSSEDTNSQEKPTTSKPFRPFKKFPKDPQQLAAAASIYENYLGSPSSMEAYVEFRNKVISKMEPSNITNKNMRRYHVGEKTTDPEYLERRRRNNESARRSREARKVKGDEIAIRCAFLENENLQLKFRLADLENKRNNMLKKLQSTSYY